VARIFKFVNMLSRVVHVINDPQDMLPIPKSGQGICIGHSLMRVESVTMSSDSESACSVCLVRVHELRQTVNAYTN
jgi:hypothetical protein